MKIAFVSDDHLTISAHFGQAQFYEVFSLEAGKVIGRETLTKSNPQLITPVEQPLAVGEHHHQHDHNAMIAPITDCQALVSRGMGRGAHISLQEHEIQPIITDILEIQSALDAFVAGTILDHPEKLH